MSFGLANTRGAIDRTAALEKEQARARLVVLWWWWEVFFQLVRHSNVRVHPWFSRNCNKRLWSEKVGG